MARRPSDPPDFEALAGRFLDLWQDQVAASAENADLTEQWRRLMAALVPVGGTPDGGDEAANGATSRAAAVAPSSGTGGDDVARLAKRVAALERRLARLEGKKRVGKPRGEAGKRAARRRS